MNKPKDEYELSKIGTKRYQNVISILNDVFGHENFKANQYKIIDTILDERDCIAIMPTGYGKSLCFQVPPLVTGELAIIVSPLIALMTDQQMIMDDLGVMACCYNSTITGKKRLDLQKDLIKGKYQIMYITPESLISSYELIDSIYDEHGICMVAIDEAHCVSSYGFDFRTSYRELYKIRNMLPNVPVLAVTATATDKVITDIQTVLLMDPIKTTLIRTSFDRPNLTIYVKLLQTSKNDIDDIKDIIDESSGSTIIYCVTQKDTEKVASFLTDDGIESRPYHAGLNSKTRQTNQEEFMNGTYHCIVATVAFGMGINKSNVRTVIHYGCPQNIESYYQEIGRAGRDGNESTCYLFYRQKDFVIQKMLIDTIRDQSYKQTRAILLNIISKYVGINTCRRKYILEYFGEKYRNENCGKCDNCIDALKNQGNLEKIKKVDEHLLYQLLVTIDELKSSYGFSTINLVLKGSNSKKMSSTMKKCTYYGSMSSLTVKDITDFMHKVVKLNYIELYDVGNCMHVLKCTKNGLDFCKEYAKKLNDLVDDNFKKDVKNNKNKKTDKISLELI